MLLIITRRDDLGADFVIDRLREREIAYLRFDVDHYLDDVQLTARFTKQGLEGEIQTPQGKSDLAAISGVWYRRAMAADLTHEDLTPNDRRFAQREARHFLEGTLGSLRCRWVNHWLRVHCWERKLAQLPLASECGLKTPPTLVCANPDDRFSFSDYG